MPTLTKRAARDIATQLRDAFARNDLLTSASAISFRLFFALIPLALFGLGLLGGSGLQGVWTNDLAPHLRQAASPAAFQVVDDTVRNVLAHRQVFWVTAGALLATWEVSGAVRAVMGVLNRVYDADEERAFARRMLVSIGLAAVTIVLLIATTATLVVAPRLVNDGVAGTLVDVLRWPVAAVLLWVTVTLVLGLAPAEDRPARRVTFGSTVVIVAWLVTSAGFAWYLRDFASYGSIYGALATVVVVLTYVYLASIAFLTGVQLDALAPRARRQATGGVP